MTPSTCTCPVCSGSGRQPVDGTNYAKYKSTLAGYDPATDTIPCQNCGGQTMYGLATGFTWARPDGTPCTHDYRGETAGNCYHVYTCIHCGHSYAINSGD